LARFGRLMSYDNFMNQLFYYCVEILKKISEITGMSYEEANIWIFVVIHPLITLLLIYELSKCKKLAKSQL